jgi:hypothetical protein
MSYYLTEQLPSCIIERKLLLELEDYVKRKCAEFVSREETSKLRYTFRISDEKGVERLDSIEEFKRSYFPDDTRRIVIECKVYDVKSLDIEINFSKFKDTTTLNVSFDGNSAREITAGIAAEILSILESYKTSNHLFHSYKTYALFAACLALISIPMNILLKSQANITKNVLIFGGAGAMASLYAVFIILFKPYSTFETRKNEKRKKQLNWVLLGALGFILFAVIGVYFRQKLFGF